VGSSPTRPTTQGGQVIDLRPDAPTRNYHDHELDYWYVQIVRPDGVVNLETSKHKDTFEAVVLKLIDLAESLSKETIAEAAKAAEAVAKAAGDASAKASTEPAKPAAGS
jgi:hypothetical protein